MILLPVESAISGQRSPSGAEAVWILPYGLDTR